MLSLNYSHNPHCLSFALLSKLSLNTSTNISPNERGLLHSETSFPILPTHSGKPPQWEEEKSTHFELGAKTCVVWLQNFSWKKIEVGDGEFIEAKEILLYAARRITSTNTTVYVDVGYCMNLPRALEVRQIELPTTKCKYNTEVPSCQALNY